MNTRKFQSNVGSISQAKFEFFRNKVNPRDAMTLRGIQIGCNNDDFGIRLYQQLLPNLHDCLYSSRLISNFTLAAHKRR